ncbi:hypothetical protein EIN_369660 [Entamoeba invadens IP1]|uniref:Uncharacterized protein n=1 Tax=Entamoeba invadens IP1 TaxID=370355 RepID=A0A0A1UFD1_ENTIV|nr:hypothetical protein EIN_369660 [Entamoeba invadens IP1]ELP92644.1 hypothetical protein EIN_369660 [Entamoeba invadens IP1]|eukprot:XP_004259415.1 hypothetical protein EIN_369660 [Entamoeba invadens IP1]
MTNHHPFQETRNYQVYEQAVFVGLINRHFSISFISPRKKSIVAKQFLTVKAFWARNDVIEFNRFIQRRVKEIREYAIRHGTPEKTAIRRGENNKIVESLHFMLDFLRELGYKSETTTIGGKNGNARTEMIDSISFDNKRHDKKEIERMGILINDYIYKQFGLNNEIVINRMDETINKYLNN